MPIFARRPVPQRLRRLGRGFLVFLALLALVHTVALVILGRDVRNRLNALRQRGESVSLVELAGPGLPDSDNAEVVCARVFRLFEGPPAWKDDGLFADCLPFLDRLPGTGQAMTPDRWKKARAAMSRYEEVPRLIERAMEHPQCRLPMKWEDGCTVLSRHLTQLEGVERYLCARAAIEARDGRMGQSAHCLDLGLGVARAAAHEPDWLSPAVREACVRMVTNTIQQVCMIGSLSGADNRRLARDLAEIDLKPDCRLAMEGERARGVWLYGYSAQKGLFAAIELFGSGQPDVRPMPALAYLWRPFLYADEILYLDYSEKQIAASSAEPASNHGMDKAARTLPRWAPMTRLIMPVIDNIAKTRDETRANLSGTQVLLALHLYRDRFGAYPDSLDVLRTRLGITLPPDPFTGKDMIYHRQGQGFLFYSVGVDRKDDGGRPIPRLAEQMRKMKGTRAAALAGPPPAPNSPDSETGDIPWIE